jgi:hypothetical protein
MKLKEKGGLGVKNLRLQNDALLLKQLHKFYNKEDIPWVKLVWDKYYTDKVPHASREVGSFWWRDVMRLSDIYRGIARCSQLGDGSTVMFWNDLWTQPGLSEQYPRLYSFARKDGISVQEIMSEEDLDAIFRLPLSMQAHEELIDLQSHLINLEYDDSSRDRWSLIWGQKYSPQKFYKFVFSAMEAPPFFKILWKSRCIPRIKFFVWLVLVDRLNTKSMLHRRHLNTQDDNLCVMCNTGSEEDIEHLFFQCPFANQCWAAIGFTWDNSLPLMERLARPRQDHDLQFFTEAALIGAWELWKIRNDKVFQRHDPTLSSWLANFKSQCILHLVRFREDLPFAFGLMLLVKTGL